MDTAKQHVLFAQQSDILKPTASSGFKAPRQPDYQTKKVPKHRHSNPVVPPAKEPSASTPGYGSQSGQGTKTKPYRKPRKEDKKPHRDMRGRGRGRGRP